MGIQRRHIIGTAKIANSTKTMTLTIVKTAMYAYKGSTITVYFLVSALAKVICTAFMRALGLYSSIS